MKKLSELQESEQAKIISLQESELGVDFVRDLLDYGFLPGAIVGLKKKQKGSDKIVLSIGETDIALRIKDAFYIEVAEYDK